MKRRTFLQLGGLSLAAACVREAGPTSQAQLRVDVWHDLVCPWCRIGLHNLGQVLDAWQGPPISLVLQPYLLSPDTPPEGVDLREHLAAKLGVPANEHMFDRVTQFGARFGVRFDWQKVRINPQTAPGHALLAGVPAAKVRPVLDALHRAHFERGLNIGLPQVLGSVAQEAGVAADDAVRIASDPRRIAEVRQLASQANAMGIDGVPNFRIGAQTLNGAQAPEQLRAALEAAARG